MSFLTDTELEKIISPDINCQENDKLIISPFEQSCLTAIGYDLRIGGKYLTLGKKGIDHPSKEKPLVVLPPNSTTLIATLENIEMPKNRLYAGLIESKVRMVCKGLSHISTTVDPDWKGNLLIAVHNHSSEKIELNYGQKLCTIIFVKNQEPPKNKSTHVSGRGDLLEEQFSAISNIEKFKIFGYNSIPPVIILLFAFVGYIGVDSNSPTFFPAMIALGSVMAQYASKYFSK